MSSNKFLIPYKSIYKEVFNLSLQDSNLGITNDILFYNFINEYLTYKSLKDFSEFRSYFFSYMDTYDKFTNQLSIDSQDKLFNFKDLNEGKDLSEDLMLYLHTSIINFYNGNLIYCYDNEAEKIFSSFFYIGDICFAIDVQEKQSVIEEENVDINEISFAVAGKFFERNYSRVEKFFSNSKYVDTLFTNIFKVLSVRYNNSSIFAFSSKQEQKEDNMVEILNNVVSLFRTFLFEIETFVDISLVEKGINKLKQLTKKSQVEIVNYIEENLLEYKDDFQKEAQLAYIRFIEEFIKTIRSLEFTDYFVDLDENYNHLFDKDVALLGDSLESISDTIFSNTARHSIIRIIQKDFVRNRMYRIILLQYGIKNFQYFNSYILFSKSWG
jgi:hypothetical protein